VRCGGFSRRRRWLDNSGFSRRGQGSPPVRVLAAFHGGGSGCGELSRLRPLPLSHGVAAVDPGVGGRIWLVAVGSGKRVAGFGEQRPDPASGHGYGVDPASGATVHGWAQRASGWARWAYPRGFLFWFFLFDLPRRASNRLGYRDLSTEAVAMPASVNRICPP
jgi:hypothetical protein